MARVVVAVRVFPSGVEVDHNGLLERIKASLPQDYSLVGSSEIPIAFGYKALRILVTMPEETEGGTDELENTLRGVEGVDEVEVEFVHRI
ncbi:MAG: elongation factor 1-beta [Acidilobaceae archaeon]|nr:elongation factor 1-beta [Acidilobaceae archaeon]MCX8165016.1 elongation factor 1-beta [Acidilobaceae archaeon]MDW7974467.1 elongation factor 1-beta [Sulfolobales archaeon]